MTDSRYNDPFIPSRPRSFWSNVRLFFSTRSALNRLIVINIIVYLLLLISGWILNLIGYLGQGDGNVLKEAVRSCLACPASFRVLAHRPWGIFTSLFVHAGFWHVFFNMIMLYVVGKIFLNFLSQKQLVITYIAGGIFGNFVYMAAYNVFPVFSPVVDNSYAVGASGSIMAIMAAITFYRPNYQLYLLFFGRIKLIWITLLFVVIDLISIPRGNAGGHIAHLGGVIYGLLYMLIYGGAVQHNFTWQRPRTFSSRSPKRRKKSKFYVSKESGRPLSDEEYNARKVAEQAQIDRILDKISQSGYGALTTEEKEFLFHYSKKS